MSRNNPTRVLIAALRFCAASASDAGLDNDSAYCTALANILARGASRHVFKRTLADFLFIYSPVLELRRP